MRERLKQLKEKASHLLQRALEKTKPAELVDYDAAIEEHGHVIYAMVRVGSFVVRERIPRQILKWSPEKASEYLDEVRTRLITKLRMPTKTEEMKVVTLNRHERRSLARKAS